MGKNKLQRFAENETFENLFQPSFYEVRDNGFPLKGKWQKDYFKNQNPLVLELGCGRGEYSVALAKHFPDKNFIGVDVKGARLWRGAKTSVEEKIPNVAFVRTRIDQIGNYFELSDEIKEIWITFPDPQPREGHENRRLTSPKFLMRYKPFLSTDHVIHLKTDNLGLFEYTLGMIKEQGFKLHEHSFDVYAEKTTEPLLTEIQTRYEKMFLGEGKKINYLRFSIT